ncbi:MAG TPA: ATP-binding protein [Planctomycetota bacterium]|nr:ATP-binding protein [Planctomycetota bacterium]HRV79930.1 ATP-binding protein [Planctomycetota bacterium]
MFVGRDHELEVLEELAESGNPELFVLYGRRRVGKTELLQRLCEPRRAVYFLAAQVRERDNLRAFRDALKDALNDPLLEGLEFPDWSTALGFAAERAGSERLILVLDEFPYLCESTKGLPSQIQKFWDTRGKKSSLMIILCGSQVSFMENEVLAERSPLFGRRTGQRRLEPLEPAESIRFFPGWPVAMQVTAFGILGGMPAYLRRFQDTRTLKENLLREVLRPEGYLFDEVQFLLRTELSSPATYNSILAAVARGADKVGDIALAVGVDSPTAGKYLHVLRELRLIEREVPITDPNPLRSRHGRYRIADRFVAFHFRHIQPNLSLIHAGRGEMVYRDKVEPDLERLFDEARQDFVLSHLRREAAEIIGQEIVEVGRFEGQFVRAVGRTAQEQTVAAIVVPDGVRGTGPLEEELLQLKRCFGKPSLKLVYGVTARSDRPLDVEQVPEGELL